MTWCGCPKCGGEPRVIRETFEGCIMSCTNCDWFGWFSECWKEDE